MEDQNTSSERLEIRRSDSNEATSDANDELQPFKDFFKGWTKADVLQGLLVVIGVLYCIVTFAMWCAMQNANGIAHNSLIASQRPWVGISKNALDTSGTRIAPDSTPGHDGRVVVMASAVIELENFGNSPAVYVSPWAFVANFTEKAIPPDNWRVAACKVASDEIMRQESQTYFIMPKSSIRMASHVFQGTGQSVANMSNLWLTGCVVYKDSLDSDLHRTVILLHSAYNPSVEFSPQGLGVWDSEAN